MKELLSEYDKIKHFYNMKSMENTYFKHNLDIILNSSLDENKKHNILCRLECLINVSPENSGIFLSTVANKILQDKYVHEIYFRNNSLFSFMNDIDYKHYAILLYNNVRVTKRVSIHNGIMKCRQTHLLNDNMTKFNSIFIVEHDNNQHKSHKLIKNIQERDIIGVYDINDLF